jgi:hypothetical protein
MPILVCREQDDLEQKSTICSESDQRTQKFRASLRIMSQIGSSIHCSPKIRTNCSECASKHGSGALVWPQNHAFMESKGGIIYAEAQPQWLLSRIQNQMKESNPNAILTLCSMPLIQWIKSEHSRILARLLTGLRTGGYTRIAVHEIKCPDSLSALSRSSKTQASSHRAGINMMAGTGV